MILSLMLLCGCACAGVRDNTSQPNAYETRSEEHISEAIEYMSIVGKKNAYNKLKFEAQSLEYISYLIHLNEKLTESQRELLSVLLSQEYVDNARADLLRAHYNIRLGNWNLLHEGILQLTEKYNESSFDHIFGEFLSFYFLIRNADELGIQVKESEESDVKIFLSKYKPVVTSNEQIYISDMGELIYTHSTTGVVSEAR